LEFTRLIRTEIRSLLKRTEFLVVMTISLVWMVVPFLMDCAKYYHTEITYIPPANELWVGFDNHAGQAYYMFLLPLLPALAYADTHYLNLKTGMYKSIYTHCRKSNYILAKGIVILTSGFLIVFLPLFLNQLLCFLIAPFQSTRHNLGGWPAYASYPSDMMMFESLFLRKPYLYNLLYMVMASAMGSMAALLSYAISFLGGQSRLIVIAVPMIIYVIWNFTTEFLLGVEYSLYAYLYGRGVGGLKPSYFFVCMVLCFLVCLAIVLVKGVFHKDELHK